jgi:hypothetical protein
MQRHRERGEGNFGCLVGLVLLLIAGLVAYKMIPVKIKAAELRDMVVNEARSAGIHHDDGRIRRTILSRAEQLGLPVTEQNVQIVRRAGYITIDVQYTVPVVFPGYTYNWKFHHATENPIF